MRLRKHGLRTLLLTSALLVSLAVPSGIASAASDYDNVAHQGSFLVKNGGCVGDVTASWMSVINDPDKWVFPTGQATIAGHLSTALANETGWAVIQREAKADHSVGNENFTTGDRYLTVLISANSSTELNFTTTVDYGKVLLPTTSVAVVQIAWTGGGSQPCVLKAIGADASVSSWYSPFAMEDNNSYVFNSHVRYDQVFVNFTINYPTGYEGEPIPIQPPPAKYVALGDSFSSGEGNPPFEGGTDTDDTNECHRSMSAYPHLLQSELTLGPTAFVACSGATTYNVLNGQWNEPPQVDALSGNTKLVTMTVGGNDVGFKDFATACTISICNFSTSAYSTIVSKINNELPQRLEDVLNEIASRVSPSTEVYVIGYPHIAPSEMPTGPNSACWPLNGQFDNPDPALNDGAAVRDVVSKINGAIASAVDGIGDSRFSYIDPNDVGSPFVDHDWCKQQRYFAIVDLPNPLTGETKHAFHPIGNGHIAYKEVIRGHM